MKDISQELNNLVNINNLSPISAFLYLYEKERVNKDEFTKLYHIPNGISTAYVRK